MTTTGEVILDDIPFRTVADQKIAELPDSKFIRRKSVQFDELSEDQRFELEELIQKLEEDGFPFSRLSEEIPLEQSPNRPSEEHET